MDTVRFAVVGAGAGGLAMAGHLALLGCDVSLYNRSAERIALIKKQGGIKLSGAIEGIGRISKITSDIAQVLPAADMAIVVVPAHAHRDVARLCAPHLREGQIVLLSPGRTGGAIEFVHTLRKMSMKKGVTVAEAQTILHTCRAAQNEASVTIFAVKRHVPIAAFPASETESVLEVLRPLFPQFTRAENVLETSLGNVGAILHPAPTLLNIGWIETLRTLFLHYYEGITPSIATFLEELDQERLEVATGLEVSVPSVRKWLCDVYGAEGDSLYEAIQATESYQEIYAPKTLNHRYIYEDVPTGLVPMASLGDVVGVDTPSIDLIVELASAICGVDFQNQGRTMDSLGLAGLGVKELHRFARSGGCR